MKKITKDILIFLTISLLVACNSNETKSVTEVQTTPVVELDAQDRVENFKSKITDEKVFNIGIFDNSTNILATDADKLKAELNQQFAYGKLADVSNFLRTDATYHHVDLDQLDDVITVDSNNEDKFPNVNYGEYAYKKFSTNQVVFGKRVLAIEIIFPKRAIFNDSLHFLTPIFTIEREDGSVYKLKSNNIVRQNYYLEVDVQLEDFNGPITSDSGHVSCLSGAHYGNLDPVQYDDSCNAIIQQLQDPYSETSEKFGLLCNRIYQQTKPMPVFSGGSVGQNDEIFRINNSQTIKVRDSLSNEMFDLEIITKEITYIYNRGDNFISQVILRGSYKDSRANLPNTSLGFSTKCDPTS